MTNDGSRDASRRRAKRNSNLKHRYGITADQFDQMAAEQDYRCGICGDRPIKGLVVDHSHQSGAVRGLICSYCNLSLGFLRENPVIVYQCAIYMEGNRDDSNRHNHREEDR